jgi:hypothetical protein
MAGRVEGKYPMATAEVLAETVMQVDYDAVKAAPDEGVAELGGSTTRPCSASARPASATSRRAGPVVPSGFTRTPGGDGAVFSSVHNGQSLEMRKAT